MRFAITPAQGKKFAANIGLFAPALSHTNCLNIVARIAGYKDWHELNQQKYAGEGPALPLNCGVDDFFKLGFSAAQKEIRLALAKQTLHALAPFAGSSPHLEFYPEDGKDDWEIQFLHLGYIRTMSKFLAHAGILRDEGWPSFKSLVFSSRPPAGDGYFYNLLRSNACTFMPQGNLADNDRFPVYWVSTKQGESITDKVRDWLYLEEAGTHRSRASFLELLEGGVRQPLDGLHFHEAEGPRWLSIKQRLLLVAQGGQGTHGILCAMPVDLSFIGIELKNKGTLLIEIHPGMFAKKKFLDDPHHSTFLPMCLAEALRCLVEYQVEVFGWGMLGMKDAQVEIHLVVHEDPGPPSNNSRDTRDMAYYFHCEMMEVPAILHPDEGLNLGEPGIFFISPWSDDDEEVD